jgi:hypothetical protein
MGSGKSLCNGTDLFDRRDRYGYSPACDVTEEELETSRSTGSGSAHGRLQKKRKARVAAAKIFYKMDMEKELTVEIASVYGSAIVMPQLARSAGWPVQLVSLAARAMLYLVLNFFLQGVLVYSLMKGQLVMDKFGGQMYLCDFGAEKAGCPDGPGCLGPLGTRMTPARTHSYQHWYIQNFAKVSLQTIFPESTDTIADKIDPGEYGLESGFCRHICTFLFIMAVTNDLVECAQILRLLCVMPSSEDTWIDNEEDENMHIQIRGMPFGWKLANVCSVVLPKYLLWFYTCWSGCMFLLETSTIEDVIVNSTALAFILSIDEMIYTTLSSDNTKFLMSRLQGFPLKKQDNEPLDLTDGEEIFASSDINMFFTRRSLVIKLPLVILIWFVVTGYYYASMCQQYKDGTWVSVPVYLPLSSAFNVMSALLPHFFPNPSADEPYWTMPEP